MDRLTLGLSLKTLQLVRWKCESPLLIAKPRCTHSQPRTRLQTQLHKTTSHSCRLKPTMIPESGRAAAKVRRRRPICMCEDLQESRKRRHLGCCRTSGMALWLRSITLKIIPLGWLTCLETRSQTFRYWNFVSICHRLQITLRSLKRGLCRRQWRWELWC